MQMKDFYIRETCRSCEGQYLFPVLSLGPQNIVDFPAEPIRSKPSVPLDLVICDHCKLVQLRHTVRPDILYKTFWYRSGVSESMRAALLDIVVKACEFAGVKEGDNVLDIGCNDGTMLGLYPVGVKRVGVDPSNQIKGSGKNLDIAINDYFAPDVAIKLLSNGLRFKVITAIAMFYDLDDPGLFLNTAKKLLTDDGVLVIQMNYLGGMVKFNAFDNICHEHITYFTLHTMRTLANQCGLEVVDVEENDVNGGSIRVYLKTMPCLDESEKALNGEKRVKALLEKENQEGLNFRTTYINWGLKIKEMCEKLSKYLIELSAHGNVIYGYGASTRGTTLLQTINAPLAGVAERDENKFGRYMVSGWFEIVPESVARERSKYMFVLPWHFKEQILKREIEWGKQGGKLIFPLPTPHVMEVVDNEWQKKEI